MNWEIAASTSKLVPSEPNFLSREVPMSKISDPMENIFVQEISSTNFSLHANQHFLLRFDYIFPRSRIIRIRQKI